MELDQIEMREGLAKLRTYISYQCKIENLVHHNSLDPDSSLLTVRYVARKFRLKQSDVIDMAEDSLILNYNVGIRTHSGIGEYNNIGDYTLEYIGNE